MANNIIIDAVKTLNPPKRFLFTPLKTKEKVVFVSINCGDNLERQFPLKWLDYKGPTKPEIRVALIDDEMPYSLPQLASFCDLRESVMHMRVWLNRPSSQNPVRVNLEHHRSEFDYKEHIPQLVQIYNDVVEQGGHLVVADYSGSMLFAEAWLDSGGETSSSFHLFEGEGLWEVEELRLETLLQTGPGGINLSNAEGLSQALVECRGVDAYNCWLSFRDIANREMPTRQELENLLISVHEKSIVPERFTFRWSQSMGRMNTIGEFVKDVFTEAGGEKANESLCKLESIQNVMRVLGIKGRELAYSKKEISNLVGFVCSCWSEIMANIRGRLEVLRFEWKHLEDPDNNNTTCKCLGV